MKGKIKAVRPTFSVRIQRCGEIVGTRLRLEEARAFAESFNRFTPYDGLTAEILREDDTVSWPSDDPIPEQS